MTARLTAGLAAFRTFGGNAVALDISAVVDISEIADPAVRAAELARFTARLGQYVTAAGMLGIEVTAVAGSPRWVLPEVRYVIDIVLSYVAGFSAAGRRLAGLELDLEPGAGQNRHLLDTVAAVAARAQVPVTFTLPCWLDGIEHLMRLLAVRPGNGVSMMVYRDTTGGPDGSVAISAAAFDLAAGYGGRVKVTIAQEITDVQPPRITFFQEGPYAMKSAMGVLRSVYGGRPSFAGFAVNDLRTLQAKLH